VADWGNNAIRDKGIGEAGAERLAGVLAQCPALVHLNLGYVTMTGAVSTVAGRGEQGFADGALAAPCFNAPNDMVVDGLCGMVVADTNKHVLRKFVGGQVTTLAGTSDCFGTADGAGTVARFNQPRELALDELRRLLVAELGRKDTLRAAEACLVRLLWMVWVQELEVGGNRWRRVRKTRRRRCSSWQCLHVRWRTTARY
jgi:hypothetical protein